MSLRLQGHIKVTRDPKRLTTENRPEGGIFKWKQKLTSDMSESLLERFRSVLDLIRNKPVDVAMAVIKNTPKAACEPLEKLLKSAIANAENNHNMSKDSLYVAQCYVTPGPTMKRIMTESTGTCIQRFKKIITYYLSPEGKGIIAAAIL